MAYNSGLFHEDVCEIRTVSNLINEIPLLGSKPGFGIPESDGPRWCPIFDGFGMNVMGFRREDRV